MERFCGNKDVCGLAGCYEDGVGSEGLDVSCIGFHHSKAVVGYSEEELVVDRSVDQSEQVRLSCFHFYPQRVCPSSSTSNPL